MQMEPELLLLLEVLLMCEGAECGGDGCGRERWCCEGKVVVVEDKVEVVVEGVESVVVVGWGLEAGGRGSCHRRGSDPPQSPAVTGTHSEPGRVHPGVGTAAAPRDHMKRRRRRGSARSGQAWNTRGILGKTIGGQCSVGEQQVHQSG
ncbi:unnamed protein product [Arctogadus glacialis]